MKTIIRALSAYRLIVTIVILCTITATVLPALTACSTTQPARLSELLSLVPASILEKEKDNPELITVIDYATSYQAAGITFTSAEQLMETVRENEGLGAGLPIGMGSYITGYGQYMLTSPIRKEYTGYDMSQIDAEIQFGMQPAQGVAAIGRFDPAAVNDALNKQTDWPQEAKDNYVTEVYKGVTIHSWGDGMKMNLTARLLPPLIDELGRARPLAVTDRYLFYGYSVDMVKQMIDASQQKAKSLADLPEYVSLTDTLAELNIYQALLGQAYIANLFMTAHEGVTIQSGEQPKTLTPEEIGVPLKKFLTFATTFGKDEKGMYSLVAIYHESSGAAKENTTLLKERLDNAVSSLFKQKWGELFTATDISAQGKVLTAKLYADDRRFWLTWVYALDNFLYYQE